jgi:hypothetical protein
MARQTPNLNSVLARTTPQEEYNLDDLNRGPVKSTSCGLNQGEVDALDRIAALEGFKRNALMRYAVRRFLVDYLQGEIELQAEPPEPTQRKLLMP